MNNVKFSDHNSKNITKVKKGGTVVKVTVIKGPNYKLAEREAHKIIYRIISDKLKKESLKTNKEAM